MKTVEEIQKAQTRTVEEIENERAQNSGEPAIVESRAEAGQPGSPVDEVREKVKKNEAFWDSITNKRKPKAPQKPDSQEDGSATATTGDPAKAKTEAQAKKPARVKKEKPEIDPLKLAEIQGREIGRQVADSFRPAPQRTPSESAKAPDDTELLKSLPEDYQADAETYLEMKNRWPDKYGNLLKDLAGYAAKEEEYIKSWEEQNPGREFNPDDFEHKLFYSKIEPKIAERDFKIAEREMIERRAEERAMKRVSPRLEKFERSQQMEELKPVIHQNVMGVLQSALSGIKPELSELGNSLESLKTLGEKDPIAAEVIADVADQFDKVAIANILIHRGVATFNKDEAAHLELFNLAREAEEEISRKPIQERIDDQGRVFVPRAQYNQMSPAERAKHWYIDQDILGYLIEQKAKVKASVLYQQREKMFATWAKSRGIAMPGARDSSQPAASAHETASNDYQAAASAPSVSGRSATGANASGVSAATKSGKDLFFGRLLRK